MLIDPLVPTDEAEAARFYDALDRDVERRGLPVAILRTILWHERSCAALRERYDTTDAWPDGVTEIRFGDPRGEVACAITEHRALAIGDIVLGSDTFGTAPPGGLRVAPASWHREPPEQAAWFARSMPAARWRHLRRYEPEIVLVGHGSPVLTDGARRAPGGAGSRRGRVLTLGRDLRVSVYARTSVARAGEHLVRHAPDDANSRPSAPAADEGRHQVRHLGHVHRALLALGERHPPRRRQLDRRRRARRRT